MRPAGPFFYLFALTASAAVPFHGRLLDAALTVVGSVAVVLVLGFAGRIRARRRNPERGLHEHPRPSRSPLLHHAGRYVAAVGAAGSLATIMGLGHNYWAMVAAAAPIAAADATGGLVRAVHRIIGTYGGVSRQGFCSSTGRRSSWSSCLRCSSSLGKFSSSAITASHWSS